MDLCKLKTFRMAAVLLNFNKTAEVLNIAQSTVSAQIKSLEDELGELLFKRIHKKIMLTEAGETMLFYANRMLSIEEEARANISNRINPTGTIRLLVPEAVSANHIHILVKQFLRSYPKINFDISNCSQSGLEHELRTESVDLAFVFSKHIDSINLNSEVVLKENFSVVVSSRSLLSEKKSIDIKDLNDQTLLLPKAGCGYGLLIKQILNLELAEPSSVIESTSIEAIKRYIVNSEGIAVLPGRSIVNEIKSKEIVELQWTSNIAIDVVMVWHKERAISPSSPLAGFMSLVRNYKGSSTADTN